MPKLYYTTTSCGAASFIAAASAGVNLETEQVDIRSHVTTSGKNYYEINPKGNVPALVLDDGTLLNEGAAVLQYIADLNPGSVAPVNGTNERYLVQNTLNYIASEVHPAIGIFFYPTLSEEVKAFFNVRFDQKLSYVEKSLLKDGEFLVNNTFSIADSYLYICLSWVPYIGKTLDAYPKVKAYFEKVGSLPNVKAAHERMATNPASVL